MNALLAAQFAAVLTVVFAGISLHQLLTPFALLEKKTAEFATAVQEFPQPRLWPFRMVLYGALPLLYLGLLGQARLSVMAVGFMAVKLGISSGLSLWLEGRLLAGRPYTVVMHRLGLADSVINIGVAIFIVQQLLFARGAE